MVAVYRVFAIVYDHNKMLQQRCSLSTKDHSVGFSKIRGLGMTMLNIANLPKHMDEIRVLLTQIIWMFKP